MKSYLIVFDNLKALEAQFLCRNYSWKPDVKLYRKCITLFIPLGAQSYNSENFEIFKDRTRGFVNAKFLKISTDYKNEFACTQLTNCNFEKIDFSFIKIPRIKSVLILYNENFNWKSKVRKISEKIRKTVCPGWRLVAVIRDHHGDGTSMHCWRHWVTQVNVLQ